jgi:hypothetical protein
MGSATGNARLTLQDREAMQSHRRFLQNMRLSLIKCRLSSLQDISDRRMLYFMEVMVPGEGHESYSSNQVCDAIGLRRTTLDAWVLRRYLPLADGPGTGKERRFSLVEAIMVATTFELTRLGLSVADAAHSSFVIDRFAADGFKVPIQEDGWLLVVGQAPRSKPIETEAPTIRRQDVIRVKPPGELWPHIRKAVGDPSAVAFADLSRIARDTAERLGAAMPKDPPRNNRIKTARRSQQ